MVLTLRTGKSEGHQAYRSQSGSTPGKGTTMGGQTDDPGRQDTRTAVARHATSGAAWRQPRVPGPGDLPHPVLPVAPAPGALRDRRLAPAPVAGAARPAAPARAAARTSHPQRRGQATWGCGRLAAHLAHRWAVHVAPSTIQRLLRRQALATRRRRL